MSSPSFLDYSQSEFIESLYESYLQDPQSVDAEWAKFFAGLDFAAKHYPVLPESSSPVAAAAASAGLGANSGALAKQISVLNLINGYRSRGHLMAQVNPLYPPRPEMEPELGLGYYGLGDTDLDSEFEAGRELGLGHKATLRTILDKVQKTYTGSVGVEFMHMRKQEDLRWLRQEMENVSNHPTFELDKKKRILAKLNEAEVFEKFLQTKYVGQKRFSLEGGEVLIPALEFAIAKAANLGCKHAIIGMAHRGRLNVLANIMGKTYEDIISEFEDFEYEKGDMQFYGDVKYHKGISTIRKFAEEDVKLTLAFNPSHLETVNTVVQGMARAKAEQWFDSDYKSICPIIIHGDAAISGQGIVYEQIQMGQLPGYTTGGIVHIVVNNQVGFTTNPEDSRSSIYCTDVGKTTFSPIFHVNGYDAEAVVYTMELAMQFRQICQRDVFVDIICTRKYGHNESDEPRFTQPKMYKILDKMASVRETYSHQLAEMGYIERELAVQMEKEFKGNLQDRMDFAKEQRKGYVIPAHHSKWSGFRFAKAEDFDQSPATGADLMHLQNIARAMSTVPDNVNLYSKFKRLLDERKKTFDSKMINWGMAEHFAFGSLLLEGNPVRITGQDVKRGTFTHRHAVLRDEVTEEEYIPLNHLSDNQSKLYIYNSLLSEYGVLGFEYGYSLSTPRRLVIWEAQFGDFANGAQIVIDQFLASAETKWKLSSGLVMLLPHGYEGQGPEHSSARLERFLQLCAHDNIQVVNCTTPANIFHVLRRQLKRDFRKPLVIMTPKSLLRHPECVSHLDDFVTGTRFQEVIDDSTVDAAKVSRVVFCSGKIYYELVEKRKELGRDDIAIVRIEQLYPYPKKQIKAICDKYSVSKQWYWVQEEPLNMGAWDFLNRTFTDKKLKVISRPASSSPAEGSPREHKKAQNLILETALQ